MEIREATDLTPDHAKKRLDDWRERVHALFDAIESEFDGTDLKVDRRGKHTSWEELAQRMGVKPPELDILRIERGDGTNAAILIPKGLWVVGANGRVDLRIIHPAGSEVYLLLDQSEPFAGVAQWVRSRISAPFEREPFEPQWLKAKLLDR
jgi:hypothetical protein